MCTFKRFKFFCLRILASHMCLQKKTTVLNLYFWALYVAIRGDVCALKTWRMGRKKYIPWLPRTRVSPHILGKKNIKKSVSDLAFALMLEKVVRAPSKKKFARRKILHSASFFLEILAMNSTAMAKFLFFPANTTSLPIRAYEQCRRAGDTYFPLSPLSPFLHKVKDIIPAAILLLSELITIRRLKGRNFLAPSRLWHFIISPRSPTESLFFLTQVGIPHN